MIILYFSVLTKEIRPVQTLTALNCLPTTTGRETRVKFRN